jgi:hypothetical protein
MQASVTDMAVGFSRASRWVSQIAVAVIIVIAGWLVRRWRIEHATPRPAVPSAPSADARHLEDPVPQKALLADRVRIGFVVASRGADNASIAARVSERLPTLTTPITLVTTPETAAPPTTIELRTSEVATPVDRLAKDASLRQSRHLLGGAPELEGLDHAATLTILARAADAEPALRALAALAASIATARRGVVIDGETGEAWSPASLAAAYAPAAPLEASALAIVRVYSVGGHRFRAVSRGLSKLALPELVVEDVPEDALVATDDLLQLAMQTLIEHRALDRDGHLDLAIAKLAPSPLRTRLLSVVGPGGVGRAELGAWFSTRRPSDPPRLMEIGWPLRGDLDLADMLREGLAAVFGQRPDAGAGTPAASTSAH